MNRGDTFTTERTVYFMAWVTILLILGGVSACSIYGPSFASSQPMTEAQLAQEMSKAMQEDREAATLAAALFAEANYRAKARLK